MLQQKKKNKPSNVVTEECWVFQWIKSSAFLAGIRGHRKIPKACNFLPFVVSRTVFQIVLFSSSGMISRTTSIQHRTGFLHVQPIHIAYAFEVQQAVWSRNLFFPQASSRFKYLTLSNLCVSRPGYV